MISDVPNLKKLQTSIFLLLLSSLLPAVSDALTLKERQAAVLEQQRKQDAENIAKQQAEAKAKVEREQRARAKKAAEKQAAEAKRLAEQAAETEKQQQAEAEKRAAQEAELKKQQAEQQVIESIQKNMVGINSGCFMMGSPSVSISGSGDLLQQHMEEQEQEAILYYPNEKQHEACVENFSIDKYEVSQKQWQAVMGDNHFWYPTGDNLPVVGVSYNDAQSFIKELNKRTNQNYRLPTEAEWEYAARAGTKTLFYTGNCINTEQANYDGNYDYNDCGAKTGVYKEIPVSVGSYPPNPWGLYDMAGNVSEWTCSAYEENYGSNETKCTTDNSALRVFRGGSWIVNAKSVRSAARNSGYKGGKPDAGYVDMGFRLALSQTVK